MAAPPSTASAPSTPSIPSSDPTEHLEIETKLEADPEFVLPDLTAVPGLPDGAVVGEPTVLLLRATYFDTRRLDLARSKVTLRRREGGTDDGWHLKLPAGAGSRREIGVPLAAAADAQDERAPEDEHGHHEHHQHSKHDHDTGIPDALAAVVGGVSRGRRLRPVARLVTARTVRPILGPDGTPLVEIADDDVTATRLLPGEEGAPLAGSTGGVPQRWREVEVEVLSGTAGQMAAVCAVLIAAGARPSGSASKLARTVGTDGEASSPDAAGDEATAGEVVLAGLRGYRQQLLIADVALRQQEPDAEAAHDARAASRRIRALLAVYGPLLLAGSVDDLSRQLRRLGRVIGATRDLDVVAERVLTGIANTGGNGNAARYDSNQQHADRLAERVAHDRHGHLARVRRTLTGKRHRSALRDLDKLIDAPPWTSLAGSPAREVLPPLLTVAWFRLVALADAALADPGTPTKTHDVRKAAKTLRYAAETAAPALGPGAVELAAYAEGLQALLGDHQDAVTATTFLADRRPDAPASTIPEELADQLQAADIAAATRLFDEFRQRWAARPERSLHREPAD